MEEKRVPQCGSTVIHAEVVEQEHRAAGSGHERHRRVLQSIWGPRASAFCKCCSKQKRCACDIAYLNMSQSAISHQLRVLKQAGIVKYRKDGRVVYYSLDDDHIKSIFDQGYKHIVEEKEKR